MGVIRYGRTAQIGVYPGNQSGRFISYRSGGKKFPLDPDTQVAWQFAKDKTLTDSVRGLTLDFVRSSIGTYVGADRLIKTAPANEPRFDHDPATGESLGLLIEEARTNICLNSEDFTGGNWVPTGPIVVNPNLATAPDGATTADQLIDDAGGGSSSFQMRQQVTVGTSNAVTLSVFAKADQLGWMRLSFDSHGALVIEQYYDLTNGAVGTPGADVDSSGIEAYRDGWYRCWLTFTSDGTDNNGQIRVGLATGDGSWLGVPRDGTSSIFAWGAMVEVGAFPTSYIPTLPPLDVVTTRAADICNTTDVTWLTQGAGTFYMRYNCVYQPGAAEVPRLFEASFSSNNYHRCDLQETAERLRYAVRNSASETATTGGSTTQSGVISKVACAYDIAGPNQAITIDGLPTAERVIATTAPTPNQLDLGKGRTAASFINGHISEFGYANVRKDNQFLQDITAP